MFMLMFFMFTIFMFIMSTNMNILISMIIMKSLNIDLEFNFNLFNNIFSLVVLLISIGVLFYSKLYFNFIMSNSYKINLMIFIFSMILLINSNNMIMMLLGWDGLGISSFYLISFYSNMESSLSALITFFFNRMGDSMMLVFSSIMMKNSSSIFMLNLNMITLSVLFFGLVTKSSQIPFGVWLPMAMSAPTPISSLVHSSTLVTAGIMVMMKMDFLFFNKEFQILIIIFSLMTFLMGGIFSFSINDMKKSVAFSTLSQLGFILFSLAIGNSYISYMHMIYHAFFKSSLFINLGFFMNFNNYIQDQRMMFNSSLNKMFKLTFFISCLNLMGIVSTSGFLSKDMILILFNNNNFKTIIFTLLYFGCLMTVCYSLKFIQMLYFSNLFNFKMMIKMKFNYLFLWFMISSLILIFIPMVLSDILILNNTIFCNKNYKTLFYMIIIFSLIKMKLMFNYFNKILMMFSTMILLMESINMMMYKIYNFMIKISFKMMFMEENFQFMMINLAINNSKMLMNFIKMISMKPEILLMSTITLMIMLMK